MTWYSPKTLEEALTILSEIRPTIVAGGTDLFVDWQRKQLVSPEPDWIDITRIPELSSIEERSDEIRIGAASTASSIWSSPLLNKLPSLQMAARVVGGWQVQNRATLAGNLANASPAADMSTALFALDAEVYLISRRGERRLSVQEFVTGPKSTVITDDELISYIAIPASMKKTKQTYIRMDQRGASDISLVSAAIVIGKTEHGVNLVRISIGGANPVPLTHLQYDDWLLGNPDVSTVEAVAAQYESTCQPITDVRASADYRRFLVSTLVTRGCSELLFDVNVN